MKLSVHLFALYILLLAVTPCCAFDHDYKQGNTASSAPRPDCNSCSPFFNCEGCATASIAYAWPDWELPALVCKRSYRTFLSVPLPQIRYEVWQPPQLG